MQFLSSKSLIFCWFFKFRVSDSNLFYVENAPESIYFSYMNLDAFPCFLFRCGTKSCTEQRARSRYPLMNRQSRFHPAHELSSGCFHPRAAGARLSEHHPVWDSFRKPIAGRKDLDGYGFSGSRAPQLSRWLLMGRRLSWAMVQVQ